MRVPLRNWTTRIPLRNTCTRFPFWSTSSLTGASSSSSSSSSPPPAALCASYDVMHRARVLYYEFLERLSKCDKRGNTLDRLVSSGLGAWVLALHMCWRVTLYGFGNSGGAAYKYFRFGRSRVHRDHNLDAERMFAEGLSSLNAKRGLGGRVGGESGTGTGTGTAGRVGGAAASWPPLTFCGLRASPECGINPKPKGAARSGASAMEAAAGGGIEAAAEAGGGGGGGVEGKTMR